MSLSTILVPLDGSRFAESAVPLAVRLARCAKAQLHLVLVHESRTALVRAATVPGPVGLEDPDVRAHGEEYLAMTAGELHALGVPVVTHTLLDCYAGPALAHEIEEQKPALVVMSSRGRRRSSSRRFGRVADYVARNTTAPVLLHRPRDAQFTSSREPHWRRILVPLDPLREW